MKRNSDKDVNNLWQSFQTGNNDSFTAIYNTYSNQLIAYGYKLSLDQDTVHDSIQEIFIDLYLKPKKRNADIKNLKSYLFIALRNKIYKKLQRNSRLETLDTSKENVELVFHVEYSYQEKLAQDEISMEIKKLLQHATAKLPSKQKEIIYLKFEEEMSYEDISVIMHISVESARKLFYRAMLSLRGYIEKKELKTIFFIFFRKNNSN
ncbi:RNA polymerase sigma factor [uncultured Draconibacterium sp.]|uniref:RNA polymerase sigma factor n=1 Tax=uncultured Draconibacterium sp. TaxID=1573823 RepID=UPI0029C7A9A7|nr:RNA polymerase sigma factor [uncultured Draconibacterium sp.]